MNLHEDTNLGRIGVSKVTGILEYLNLWLSGNPCLLMLCLQIFLFATTSIPTLGGPPSLVYSGYRNSFFGFKAVEA